MPADRRDRRSPPHTRRKRRPHAPSVTLRTSSGEAVRSMVANGRGVTILSDLVPKQSCRLIRSLPWTPACRGGVMRASPRQWRRFGPISDRHFVFRQCDKFHSDNAIKRASCPKPRQHLPGEGSAHVLGGHLSPYYQEDEDDHITT